MTRKKSMSVQLLNYLFGFLSMWKTQMGKGVETRRPLTADSAKTSNMDSDDNLDGEESN
jgi:hypothetical protein